MSVGSSPKALSSIIYVFEIMSVTSIVPSELSSVALGATTRIGLKLSCPAGDKTEGAYTSDLLENSDLKVLCRLFPTVTVNRVSIELSACLKQGTSVFWVGVYPSGSTVDGADVKKSPDTIFVSPTGRNIINLDIGDLGHLRPFNLNAPGLKLHWGHIFPGKVSEGYSHTGCITVHVSVGGTASEQLAVQKPFRDAVA